MATNGDSKQILAGMQLVLEEIRDLRREAADDRKQAAEDRKQAAEDRRQLIEYIRHADERAVEDRRKFNQESKIFAKALILLNETGKKINEKLDRIIQRLEGRGNGH